MAARVSILILMTGLFAAAWSGDVPRDAACGPVTASQAAAEDSSTLDDEESSPRCLAQPVRFPPGAYDAVDNLGRKLKITVAVVKEPSSTSASAHNGLRR